jgi:hypothetical protein
MFHGGGFPSALLAQIMEQSSLRWVNGAASILLAGNC